MVGLRSCARVALAILGAILIVALVLPVLSPAHDDQGEALVVNTRKMLGAATPETKVTREAGAHEPHISTKYVPPTPTATPTAVPETTKASPTAPALPPPLLFWPRPFGLNRDTVRTPAGRMQQGIQGQENDAAQSVGSQIAAPTRWVFSKEHTSSWRDVWEANIAGLSISTEMLEGIRTMASAFLAYDENPHANTSVPAYATICGNSDCPILKGHFSSLRTCGRFILVLNTVKREWIVLAKALEKAFPQRFIVEYSMLRTRQLYREQNEYTKRHGDNGIGTASQFISAEDNLRRFREQDIADDARDAEGGERTAYYRWHLRNLHPDLLRVPLSQLHSVSMGWNRILNLCFRGPTPIDYLFIANGDFYLKGADLPTFASYTSAVIRDGPADRVSLGGYQDALSYAFFAYTYKAWTLFGEFDESMFPLYHEDNEFHARILAGGMDMFTAYDKKFAHHEFEHVGSMSRSGATSVFSHVVGRMNHPPYLHAKYDPHKIGLTQHPRHKTPFGNKDIDLRNAWAIDTKYRACLFASNGHCSMDAARMQSVMLGKI